MSNQALYRSLMKQAAANSRDLIHRTIRRAALKMPELAQASRDVVERGLLTDAAHVLMKHEAQLVEAYPQALLAEFAHAIAGDTRKAAVSFESLELMADEQVQEGVEMTRVQQAVLRACEGELTQLNALVAAVQGLPRVQPDRNPLRPDTYVRALRQVIQQSPVSASVRRRWTTHLGTALGPELADGYRELSQMLRSQGVVEAVFQVVVREDTAAQRTQAASRSHLNVHELRKLLAGHFDPVQSPASTGEPTAFSATVPAAFEVLQEMKQAGEVAQRMALRRVAGGAAASGANLRDAFAKEARSPGQALAIEVVGLMIDNIAGDARLLEPVREAVRDLEPALLRLALADPRFFSDKSHPARRLLDDMTQRSLAWTSTSAPGFSGFFEPLRQGIEALVDTRATGAEPFEFALKTLQEAWGDAQERERRQREKAVRTLLRAEQRNLLAGRIARELLDRPEVAGAPGEIARFLAGPWSQVLAKARLAEGEGGDAEGYAEVVRDLVWSAQPELARANPARLVRLVPSLVERVRRGLASIDYPAGHVAQFLAHLASLHEQALRPAEAVRATAGDELESRFNREAQDGSWLAPMEMQQSSFMTTHQSVPHDIFPSTQVSGPSVPQDGPELPDVPLQSGAWVEILEGSWVRWQLTWASPHGTLFLFTHPGGSTRSMTGRLLHRMIAAGSLRLVSSQDVVAHALDEVAQAALRNSIDLSL